MYLVKYLHIIGFIFSVSFLLGQETTTMPKVKTSEIKNFNLNKGDFEKSLVMSNNEFWNIHFSIPEIKEGTKVPLIIALHWAGGGDTYLEYANCLALPAMKFLNAIIVSPSGDYDHWVDAKNEQRLIAMIKLMKKHWPINAEQIIITGYSNGGIGSWYFARKYPKLFAAAIPMAAYYSSNKVNIPMYAIHGEKDELFNLQEAQSFIKKSEAKGSLIDLTILEGKSHYEACSYLESLNSALKKVEIQVLKN
jgi:predicted peptidase